jgi:hypothetical protein
MCRPGPSERSTLGHQAGCLAWTRSPRAPLVKAARYTSMQQPKEVQTTSLLFVFVHLYLYKCCSQQPAASSATSVSGLNSLLQTYGVKGMNDLELDRSGKLLHATTQTHTPPRKTVANSIHRRTHEKLNLPSSTQQARTTAPTGGGCCFGGICHPVLLQATPPAARQTHTSNNTRRRSNLRSTVCQTQRVQLPLDTLALALKQAVTTSALALHQAVLSARCVTGALLCLWRGQQVAATTGAWAAQSIAAQ